MYVARISQVSYDRDHKGMRYVNTDVAIYACEKGGEWEKTFTYNAAISACEKGGEWEEALQLLSMMMQGKVGMDIFTCSVAINACEKGGEWQRWERIQIREGSARGEKMRDLIERNAR